MTASNYYSGGRFDGRGSVCLHHGEQLQEALYWRDDADWDQGRSTQTRRKPDSHTARYVLDKLVYLERFTTLTAAIAREKQLKGWLRARKLELIISTNPTWVDLSAEWGKAIEPYAWPESS
jgi:predicted GIY-YIG superfamily endonuclease